MSVFVKNMGGGASLKGNATPADVLEGVTFESATAKGTQVGTLKEAVYTFSNGSSFKWSDVVWTNGVAYNKNTMIPIVVKVNASSSNGTYIRSTTYKYGGQTIFYAYVNPQNTHYTNEFEWGTANIFIPAHFSSLSAMTGGDLSGGTSVLAYLPR